MNDDILQNSEQNSLVGPQSSVNLMEPTNLDEPSSSFSVDVHDEDKAHIPSDIIPDSDLSFWKRPDVKMWLYILAGTVIIFAIVFAILTKETSVFKGYLVDSTETTTDAQNDEDIFGEFNNRAANETSNDEDSVPQETSDEETIVDDAPVVGSEIDNNDGSEVVVTKVEEDIIDNEPIFDDFEVLFDDGLVDELPGTIPNVPTIPDEFLDFEFTDSLASNTNANIMASSEVQGDTGPAIWIAMVPSMLYALRRKKK
jgi:hypothetical protein